jgi:hypothetical protein
MFLLIPVHCLGCFGVWFVFSGAQRVSAEQRLVPTRGDLDLFLAVTAPSGTAWCSAA